MKTLKSRFQLIVIIFTILVLAIPPLFADANEPKPIKITSPRIPPDIVVRKRAEQTAKKTFLLYGAEHTLQVPAYIWRHGCTPTAIGMVIGYHDGLGHFDLIPGDASWQNDNVNQAIASSGTPEDPCQHYEDYSVPEDNSVTGLLPDDYIGKRSPHANNCLGDYLHTSQSIYNLYYGYTWNTDEIPGFVAYVNSRNSLYQPTAQRYLYASLWNALITEIDNGRPMEFSVDCLGSGTPDHSVTVVGYRTSPNQYACLDTWFDTISWWDFLPVAGGTVFGVYDGYSFDLTKWVQMPEQTNSGIDIRCDRSDGLPRILADDFECTSTGMITQVALWGSWKNDIKGNIKKIRLSIYQDIPADDPCNPYGYSMPGDELWSHEFSEGDFTETLYTDLDPNYEWYWDAARLGEPNSQGDQKIWRYDIPIDPHYAFVQQGKGWEPVIYWLAVSIETDLCCPSAGYTSSWSKTEFGWKTSKDSWGDNGVWSNDDGKTWNELTYPLEHPLESDDISFAFLVDTNQPASNMDFGDCPDPRYPTLLIHNGARHTVNQGIRLGATIDSESSGKPDQNASGDDNDGNDDEDGVTFTSPIIPGSTANFTVNASMGGRLYAWIDFNADGDWDDSGERIFNGRALAAGNNNLTFNVPAYVPPDTNTYARFRFTTAQGDLTPTGLANNGEVEDYLVHISSIKWMQPPDVNSTGIDIRCDRRDDIIRVLADDFKCTNTGLITKVILWGSWKNDIKGQINKIHLSIHSDIPAAQNPPSYYSKPGIELWSKDFYIGDFNETLYRTLTYYEWWWDPNMSAVSAGDRKIWQYDIPIDPCEAFLQQGDPCNPVIYWLDVYAQISSPNSPQFGWKTSTKHWNDNAVWYKNDNWHKLQYPSGHPYNPQPIDLAFEIVTEPQNKWSQPPVPNLKWSQPPIEINPTSSLPAYCGWNQPSLREITDTEIWHLAADDFRCLGTMPITSIHWWGSYLNWKSPVPPDNEPNVWQIGFWSNVEDPNLNDPCNFSYPHKLLWQIAISANRVEQVWVGTDLFGTEVNEACFQYYIDLQPQEYFRQSNFLSDTNDNIFWISVAAVYPDACSVLSNPWGWKTRPWHWMDDAVTFDANGSLVTGRIIDPCNITPLENDTIGGVKQSYDMAFELDTDPCWVKWEQSFSGIRNWPYYEDVPSCMVAWPDGNDIWQTAADDWLCRQRRPVTAIVWWGSYLCYSYKACTDCAGPLSDADRPDYFLITVLDDVAADDPCNIYQYSHPGKKIWEYKAFDYDEVLIGYDTYPEAGPNEPVFRYSVRLPEENWFHQPDVNGIFWLSIVAVYQEHYPDYAWGWVNYPHTFQDNAVSGFPGFIPDDSNQWQWYRLYDQTGANEDLSFILFTDPAQCSTNVNYNLDNIINFEDYRYFANDWRWLGQAGGYNNSDLNCDGTVNFEDLDVFVNQWLNIYP